MTTDAYSLLRAWRACMTEPRPSDWERIASNLLADTSAALEEEARPAAPPPRKQYKVVDLSYSQDARRHLKDVRAYHELDGWRLLSVVHLEASGRWLYYLERDAEPGPQGGVTATAVGSELSLPGPVRRVGGGGSGEVVTAGADVTKDGVTVGVFRRPPRLTLDEFRRLRWERTEGGIVTEDPAHVPLIEKFLEAKDDPERLRAFVEQDLGGEWQEEPYGSAGPS